MIANKIPAIHTPRLTLRTITESDDARLIATLKNPEVGLTYMVPDLPTRADEERILARFVQLSADPRRFLYGIYREEELIGFLNDVETTEDSIELGLVIHPDHKGRGYATEALTAAMEVLFDMGYAVVKTGVFEENLASRRVMEKSGMTQIDLRDQLEYRGKTHTCVWFEKRRA